MVKSGNIKAALEAWEKVEIQVNQIISTSATHVLVEQVPDSRVFKWIQKALIDNDDWEETKRFILPKWFVLQERFSL